MALASARPHGARSALAVDLSGRHVAFATPALIEIFDVLWPSDPRLLLHVPLHAEPALLDWGAHDASSSLLVSCTAERVLVWDVARTGLEAYTPHAALEPHASAARVCDVRFSPAEPYAIAIGSADGVISACVLGAAGGGGGGGGVFSVQLRTGEPLLALRPCPLSAHLFACLLYTSPSPRD